MRTIDWPAWKGISLLVGALAVASLIGFYPGYFSQFPRFARSGWEVHFHLATIIAWLALLVAQAWLATRGRYELHRRLGRWSYVVVPLIIVGFVLVTGFGQRRHREPALLGAAFFDGSLFLLFYVLAIVKRKNAALHSRYMMLTAIAFINPALGRAIAPQVSVPFEFLLIVTLLVVSRLKRRPWQPFLAGVIAYPSLMAVVIYCSFVEPAIMDRLWTAIWG
jgi:hypothetical protein